MSRIRRIFYSLRKRSSPLGYSGAAGAFRSCNQASQRARLRQARGDRSARAFLKNQHLDFSPNALVLSQNTEHRGMRSQYKGRCAQILTRSHSLRSLALRLPVCPCTARLSIPLCPVFQGERTQDVGERKISEKRCFVRKEKPYTPAQNLEHGISATATPL